MSDAFQASTGIAGQLVSDEIIEMFAVPEDIYADSPYTSSRNLFDAWPLEAPGFMNTYVLQRHNEEQEMISLRRVVTERTEPEHVIRMAQERLTELDASFKRYVAASMERAQLVRNAVGVRSDEDSADDMEPQDDDAEPQDDDDEAADDNTADEEDDEDGRRRGMHKRDREARQKQHKKGVKLLQQAEAVPTRAITRADRQDINIADMFASIQAGWEKMLLEYPSRFHFSGDLPGSTGMSEDLQLSWNQRESIGQIEDILSRNHGVLLGDEMGSGKSISIITTLALQRARCRTEGKSLRVSLIVAPAALVTRWSHEIDHFDPTARVMVYHGNMTKGFSRSDALSYDIVLTTYDTLLAHWKSLKRCQVAHQYLKMGWAELWKSAKTNQLRSEIGGRDTRAVLNTDRCTTILFETEWDRVVFDEAHILRNKDAHKMHAALDLRAVKRIAVTGTAVQNKIDEVFSIMRLLSCTPWNNWQLFHACFLETQSRKGQSNPERTFIQEVLLPCILRSIMVKTPSHISTTVLDMTRYAIITQVVIADEITYATQEDTSWLWHPTTTRQKPMGDKVFAAIMSARLAASHPALPEAGYGEISLKDYFDYDPIADSQTTLRLMGSEDSEDEETRSRLSRSIFTQEERLRQAVQHTLTREERRQLGARRAKFVQDVSASEYGLWSPKLSALRECLKHIAAVNAHEISLGANEADQKRIRAYSKVLVFDDHLSTLDLCEAVIRQSFGPSQEPRRLDGTIKNKQMVIDEFEETGKDWNNPAHQPSDSWVILVTSKTAPFGLNLVHAKWVIILSPMFNVTQRDQCIARAARMGNPNMVLVFNFYVAESIEEWIRHEGRWKERALETLYGTEAVTEARHVRNMQALTCETLNQLFYRQSEGYRQMRLSRIR